MRRNMELIQKILEWVEEHGEGAPAPAPELEKYSNDEVTCHIMLSLQAGFLENGTMEPYPLRSLHAYRLTWKGHEELDQLRGNGPILTPESHHLREIQDIKQDIAAIRERLDMDQQT